MANSNRKRSALDKLGFYGWLLLLAVAPFIGIVAMGVYAWNLPGALNSWRVFAIGLLLAAGAFIAGGMIGFLFAIPRTTIGPQTAIGAPEERASYRSNSNLEEISDWLTKILVGLGLVELGRVSAGGRRLVDFIYPAFGHQVGAKPLAAGILIIYSISGLLIIYIATRIYGGPAFARAEEDLREYVDRRIAQVEESQRQQAEADARVLAAVEHQLEAASDAPLLSQAELNEAVANATAPARALIFTRARSRRLEGAPEETIPVFKALIASDTERRFHRNHAQLAYALAAKSPPDAAAAEKELSEAIEIRDRTRAAGFRAYDAVRTKYRIDSDPNFEMDEPSSESTRALIDTDMKRARESPKIRDQMASDPKIQKWISINHPQAEEGDGGTSDT